MAAYLSRDQILQADDLQAEDVAVPEWGGTVRVRGLTGAERDAFEAAIVEQRGRRTELNLQNVRARLVALSVIDENGERVFSDGDVRELGRKSGTALQRVFEVAQRLAGLSQRDVEELSKTSSGGLSAASHSD